MLARNGTPAPGAPRADFLSFSQLPRINAAGEVAFTAFLTRENDSDAQFHVGIWRGSADDLELVVRTNELALTEEPSVRFGDLALPNINDHGDVSFQAVLVGDTVSSLRELSLWVTPFGEHESRRLVARAGDNAPGTAMDVEFRAFSTHVLNSAGHLAFMAVVGGPNVSVADGNVNGIWAEDGGGNLVLIVRDGDSIEVAPGDVRTIESLAFQANAGNSDGQPSGYSDNGMIAFRARFMDGTSGIFVSNTASVPEPKLTIGIAIIIGLVCRPVEEKTATAWQEIEVISYRLSMDWSVLEMRKLSILGVIFIWILCDGGTTVSAHENHGVDHGNAPAQQNGGASEGRCGTHGFLT